MTSGLVLAEKRSLPMHWRTGEFPHMGHVWLVRFKSKEVCVCRVSSSDDLGGNLVELSLQCLRWSDMATTERHYSFLDEGYVGATVSDIESWVRLETMNTEEWQRFVYYCKRVTNLGHMSEDAIAKFVKTVCHSEIVFSWQVGVRELPWVL